MEKIMDIEEFNHSTWVKNLNVFLSMIELEAHFDHYLNGVILNKKNQRRGELAVMRRTTFSSVDAYVRGIFSTSCIFGDVNLKLVPNEEVLSFQLENLKDHKKIKGVMLPSADLMVQGMKIIAKEKGQEPHILKLCSNHHYFSYESQQTDESLSFSKHSFSCPYSGITFEARKKDQENDIHNIEIMADPRNQTLKFIEDYNSTRNFFQKSPFGSYHLSNENTAIWTRIRENIEKMDVGVYEQISSIFSFYDLENGKNMLVPFMKEIVLPQMTEEQADCCFGKELVKSFSSRKK